MTLVDFLTSPWAILPEKLLEIQAIYATHFRGEKIDIAALEARLGHPLANDQQEYRIEHGGVAVLSVSGVMSNKANMFTKVSGGVSAQMLQRQVNAMRGDPNVKAAVLDFDTPGGSVFGIPALAAEIRALASEKPTVSVSTGMMASAGYWTGSAANSVYLSGETDYMGSIGVVATHAYDPREKAQVTEITAGKYKRIASDNAPLTEEGRAYIQQQVDQIYSAFVDAVATNRRVTPEQVLSNMADGRIFIGEQAVKAGLADGIATVETMVERLATDPMKYANRRKAVFALGSVSGAAGAAAEDAEPATSDAPVLHVETATSQGTNAMNPQELAAKFAAEHPEAYALIRTEGADAERARIQAVREQSMPGHEKLIDALAFDGKTSGAAAAVQVLAAEKQRRAGAAAARDNDAPGVVPQEPAQADVVNKPNIGAGGALTRDTDAHALDAAAKEYQAKNPGVSYVDAIKAVQKGA